jgi:hypothetical protein
MSKASILTLLEPHTTPQVCYNTMQEIKMLSGISIIDVSSVPTVPQWLQGCWRRAYIHQHFRQPKKIDEDNIVFYIQGPRLAIDLRLLQDRISSTKEQMECFAGLTRCSSPRDQQLPVVSWFPLFEFPSPAEDDGSHSNINLAAKVAAVASSQMSAEDQGLAKLEEGGCAWIERDVPTGGSELEERWERVFGFDSEAATCCEGDELDDGNDCARNLDSAVEGVKVCIEEVHVEVEVEEWMSSDAVLVHVGKNFGAAWRGPSKSGDWRFVVGSAQSNEKVGWEIVLSTHPDLEGRKFVDVFQK